MSKWRLDIRCPVTNGDEIYLVTEIPKILNPCKSCKGAHNLVELQALRTEIFAPCYPWNGKPFEGYVGAVCISPIKYEKGVDVWKC